MARTRRTMHGRRSRRSPLPFIPLMPRDLKRKKEARERAREQQLDIGAGVTVGTKKSASEPPNYTPKKEEIHNPMEQASTNLAQKDMNINRDGRVTV